MRPTLRLSTYSHMVQHRFPTVQIDSAGDMINNLDFSIF